MDNEQNTLNTELTFSTDKSSQATAIRSLEDVEKRLLATEKANKTLSDSAKKAADALRKQITDLKTLAAQKPAGFEAAVQAQNKLNALVQQQLDLEERIASEKKAARTESFGRASTGLSSIAAVSSAIPGGGVATEGLRIAGDLAGAAEQMPRLAEGARGIAASLPLVSTAAATLTPILGATGASVAALAAAALPIAAVVAGVALAFAELNRIANEAKAQVQAQVEASKNRVQTEREIADLLKSGDEASAQARLAELQAQQEDANILLTELYEAQRVNKAAYEALGASLNIPERQRLAAQASEIEAQITALYGEGFEARSKEQAAIEAALPDIQKSAVERAKDAKATEDAAKAEADLAREREQAASKIEQINARLISLDEQATKARSANAENLKDIDDDRRRRDARAEEDYREDQSEKLEAHNARLADIDAAGKQKLLDIHNELNGLPAALAADQLAATDKFNESVGKLNADFMRSEISAVAKFHEQERKAESANKKARLRAIEDLQDSLLNAETANDVLAFIQAKNAGEQELRRQQEDADDATRERSAAFLDERRQANEQYNQRKVDLETALTAETTSIHAEYEKRRMELATSLAQEAKATEDARAKELAAFAKQQADEDVARAKALQRQREDDARADERRNRAFNAIITEIENKKNAELAALRQVAAVAAGIRVGTGSSSFTPSSPQGAFGANRGGSTSNRILGVFDDGRGFVPKGTKGWGYFGGQTDEWIVKQPPNKMGSSQVIAPVINLGGVNVGSIVSPAEAQQIAHSLAQQVGNELMETITGGNIQARFAS